MKKKTNERERLDSELLGDLAGEEALASNELKIKEKKASKGFRALFTGLEHSEKKFVREALKDADYLRASREAGHKYPFELLARSAVRKILLSSAPYSALAAQLLRPYVIESLMNNAISGNANCAKILLTLSDKAVRVKRVSYGVKAKENPEPSTSAPGGDAD